MTQYPKGRGEFCAQQKGGGLKTKMGRTSMHAPRTQGGVTPNEASRTRGRTKTRPADAGGGVLAKRSQCTQRRGKIPAPQKEGGVAKISVYEASILSAILKEPAPTLKGGGPTKRSQCTQGRE